MFGLPTLYVSRFVVLYIWADFALNLWNPNGLSDSTRSLKSLMFLLTVTQWPACKIKLSIKHYTHNWIKTMIMSITGKDKLEFYYFHTWSKSEKRKRFLVTGVIPSSVWCYQVFTRDHSHRMWSQIQTAFRRHCCIKDIKSKNTIKYSQK